jgi:hypothetical protein
MFKRILSFREAKKAELNTCLLDLLNLK